MHTITNGSETAVKVCLHFSQCLGSDSVCAQIKRLLHLQKLPYTGRDSGEIMKSLGPP